MARLPSPKLWRCTPQSFFQTEGSTGGRQAFSGSRMSSMNFWAKRCRKALRSTGWGTRKPGLLTQTTLPSASMPAPGTTAWRWGWKSRRWFHECRIMVKPLLRAPSQRGLARVPERASDQPVECLPMNEFENLRNDVATGVHGRRSSSTESQNSNASHPFYLARV